MPSHSAFFWGSVFFLLGVLLVSLWGGVLVFSVWVGIFTVLLLLFVFVRVRLFRNYFWHFLLLSFLIFFGAFYYGFYETLSKPYNIPFGEYREITGVVIFSEKKLAKQDVVISAREPFEAKIYAAFPISPEVGIGDEISVKGNVEKPETKEFARYLKKDNIFAVMGFPEVEILSKSNKFSIKKSLTSFSQGITDVYAKVLPQKESSLLSGIMVGDTSEFSKDFKESMRRSGTTHIVALSGYNITVLIMMILPIFSFFLKRKSALVGVFLFIACFVVMTGMSPSVVRSAFMAGILAFLKIGGRLTNPKNIIVFTALIMVLINPRVIGLDVGFQLSFLAFLGIVYLQPVFEKFVEKRTRKKISFWGSAALTTLSAQLMTLPFLLLYFKNVFATSIVANTLIVALLPIIMALGLVIAGTSLISYYISLIFGWFSYPLLKIEVGIIEFFSKFALAPISFKIGFLGVGLYYICTAVFIYLSTGEHDRTKIFFSSFRGRLR